VSNDPVRGASGQIALGEPLARMDSQFVERKTDEKQTEKEAEGT
jgi:hypothetical protein